MEDFFLKIHDSLVYFMYNKVSAVCSPEPIKGLAVLPCHRTWAASFFTVSYQRFNVRHSKESFKTLKLAHHPACVLFNRAINSQRNTRSIVQIVPHVPSFPSHHCVHYPHISSVLF